MEKQLTILQEACIHCGLCVMMDFADNKNGMMIIKSDLPQNQYPQAENCCPVGAIVQIESENHQTRTLS